MGLTTNKTVITKDGKLLFIPSGSGVDGIIQKYAITMSGVFVSESILATSGTTASFWYLRTTTGHSTKIFYQNTASSAVEPTGSSLDLIDLNNQHFQASSSAVQVVLQPGMTGSAIVRQTANAMRGHPMVSNNYTISSSGDKLFIDSNYTGLPPTDDISFVYMTGSSFSYNVIQSGSNATIYNADAISGSATVQYSLNSAKSDQLDTSMPDSRSFINVKDGFYGISVTKALTGSNISMHGGVPLDIGFDFPNPPYIKTNGGFDILMDNADSYDNSNFRVFKDTGITGVGGTELFKIDEHGSMYINENLVINASGSVDGGSF